MSAATTAPHGLDELMGILRNVRGTLKTLAPPGMDADRLIELATDAYTSRSDLQKCPPSSVVAAVVKAAKLGLEPDNGHGHAWLIPRKNKDTGQTECQLQVGYKGHLKLLANGGSVSGVEVGVVRPKDKFHFCYGSEPHLVHVPADSPDFGQATHYWALIRRRDGSSSFRVMARAEVEVYRNRSSQPNGRAWKSDYDAMALKAVILRLVGYEVAGAAPVPVVQARRPEAAAPIRVPAESQLPAARDEVPASGHDSAPRRNEAPAPRNEALAPRNDAPATAGLTNDTRNRLMTLAIHLRLRGETQAEIPGGAGVYTVKTIRLDAALQELLGLPDVGDVPITHLSEPMGLDLIRALEQRLEAAGAQ